MSKARISVQEAGYIKFPVSPVVSEAVVPNPNDEILRTLKGDIEDLSDGQPMWSRSAYTARQTVHRIFANGVEVAEGGERVFPTNDIGELARITLTAVKAYRQTILGPVDLVWRVEPEFRLVEVNFGDTVNDRFQLYTRLCFEPRICKVSRGVWVETRMIDGQY